MVVCQWKAAREINICVDNNLSAEFGFFSSSFYYFLWIFPFSGLQRLRFYIFTIFSLSGQRQCLRWRRRRRGRKIDVIFRHGTHFSSSNLCNFILCLSKCGGAVSMYGTQLKTLSHQCGAFRQVFLINCVSVSRKPELNRNEWFWLFKMKIVIDCATWNGEAERKREWGRDGLWNHFGVRN